MDNEKFIKWQNKSSTGKLALWGATLLSYCPRGETQDIFWLGERNKFDGLQAIRGGIPVCWPRFAAEKLNDNLPRHGFARISDWKISALTQDENKLEAELILPPDERYQLDITAKLRIKVTDTLEYCLETTNNGDEIFEFSEALHCYFNVSSLDNVILKGLQGHLYKSSLDGSVQILTDDLRINGEFDAAFLNHTGKVEIVDQGYKRVIAIEKSGSQTTVVWNPAKDLAEMGEGQYQKFVCVEPANQGDYFVRLQPHATHRLTMKISCRSLLSK